jgi:hypothetical protein
LNQNPWFWDISWFGTPYCFYSHFKWILSDQQKWYITWKNIQYEDHGTISNWLSFILLKGTKWFFQFNFDMFKMNLECKIYLCLGLVNMLKFVLIKMIRNNSLMVYMAEQILLIQCIRNIHLINTEWEAYFCFWLRVDTEVLLEYTLLWTSHI